MKYISPILILLLSFSPALFAGETLYRCMKASGEVILADKKPHNCQDIKKYAFDEYASKSTPPEGLRPEEKANLEAVLSTPSNQPSYTELYQQSFYDAHRDRCHFYKSQIENAINQLQFHRGVQMTQKLRLEILQAEKMTAYYCYAPDDLVTPNPNAHYSRPERYKQILINP